MAGRPKPDPEKYCGFCGKRMLRKRFGERLEDRKAFLRRKFCDASCGNSRHIVTQSGLLQRSRKHRGSRCEACGFARRPHVHHVDGNQKHSAPPNLQTLCTHCHNFWHAMLNRLGLPIAGRMPPLLCSGMLDSRH